METAKRKHARLHRSDDLPDIALAAFLRDMVPDEALKVVISTFEEAVLAPD
jgi:hypothetical protein